MLVKYRYLQWFFIVLFVVASNSFAGGWEQVTELPIWRYGNTAAAVYGKIYIIGGYDLHKNLGGRAPALSIVDVYDTQTNTWHKVANMPTPRVAPQTAVFSNEIYVFGGYDRKGRRGARRNKKTVEMYDTQTDTWIKKRDMPSLRMDFTTAVVDGKIYVIGGRVEHQPFKPMPTNLVEVYDPLINKWEKRADMPTARAGADAVVVDGKVYVLGGQNTWVAPGLAERFITRIEEYNPKTNKWQQFPDMPMFKFWFASVVVNNEIYTIGGANNKRERIDAVDVYNPTVDKWRKIESLPTPKDIFAAVVVNGTIYTLGSFIGGVGGGKFSPIVEAFDTDFRAVTAKGKLSTNWGELKAENQK
ncbi:MAG: hypothetical protein OYL97_16120 [Candidatus Poribacteria bacterium]|nr:hypothetical protein [Candidatus Poribacteria bacterium]